MAETRSRFGPVVLLGLGSAALASLAGNKPWLSARQRPDLLLGPATDAAEKFPLAGAVALLLLATWGVLLVTRLRMRRVLAVLAVVESLGLLTCAVLGPSVVRTQIAKSAQATGAPGPWFWTFVVATALTLAAAVLAVRTVKDWPEMGARYDAPTGEKTQVEVDLDGETGNRELWKAIDEGHDPTAH
jgi:uncharacterized membrane protein (TIGR02234 family)